VDPIWGEEAETRVDTTGEVERLTLAGGDVTLVALAC
jgi:hypothetical protein